MSDISNSSSTSSNKRRLSKIDDDIEYLTQEANNLNDFVYKTQFECSLMTVKMKREKIKALSAFAKSQVLLADMEIMIAEGDLYTDIERLRNFKKLKLEREEGQLQKDAPQERNSKSVHTTKTKSDKKKRRHSSSRTSSVENSTEETVITPTIHESTASLVETSQTSKTCFQSLDLFKKSPTNKSDSEVSLSNSIKAAFNEPYTNTQTQEPIKKSPAKKNKSDKKVEFKYKSKHAAKQTESPTDRPNTVADPRKSVNTFSNPQNSPMVSAANNSRTGEKKTMTSSTFVPVRHNMPAVLTQPSTQRNCTRLLYINPAQYHSQKAGNSNTFDFYGSKQ